MNVFTSDLISIITEHNNEAYINGTSENINSCENFSFENIFSDDIY